MTLNSCAISGATFYVVATLQASFPNDGPRCNKRTAVVFATMISILNFAFSSDIGPLSCMVPVEVFNTELRAKGTALTSMAAWISSIMISQATPRNLQHIRWRYYLVFAIFGFTNAAFFFLVLLETK